MPAPRPVAILGGVRIPFCRQNTAYADVGNLGMSVRTLGALVERFGLHGQQLGEVAMGAVIKHSSDWNLGREAALSSGLSPLTPGITLQRACGCSAAGQGHGLLAAAGGGDGEAHAPQQHRQDVAGLVAVVGHQHPASAQVGRGQQGLLAGLAQPQAGGEPL